MELVIKPFHALHKVIYEKKLYEKWFNLRKSISL